MPGAKRMQQGNGRVMIWILIGQINIEPFKIDEVVKRNSDNYSGFINRIFFAWYKSEFSTFRM